jgi:hypothetical protein
VTLSVPVSVDGRRASEGVLSLGISRAGELQASTWFDTRVGKDGRARLAGLKPGTYRILRSYHPAQPPAQSRKGHWLDGEIRLRVTTGATVQAPPLRWVADPPGN